MRSIARWVNFLMKENNHFFQNFFSSKDVNSISFGIRIISQKPSFSNQTVLFPAWTEVCFQIFGRWEVQIYRRMWYVNQETGFIQSTFTNGQQVSFEIRA